MRRTPHSQILADFNSSLLFIKRRGCSGQREARDFHRSNSYSSTQGRMSSSYGSIPKEEAEPEHAPSFMTELRLMVSSPGLWLVVIYAIICNHFNDAVTVNIRPSSGEHLHDGEFVKNPE